LTGAALNGGGGGALNGGGAGAIIGGAVIGTAGVARPDIGAAC